MSDDINPLDLFMPGVTETKAAVKAGKAGVKMITPDMPATPEQKVAPVPDDEQRRVAIQRFLARRFSGSGREGTKLSSGTLG